MSPLRSFPSHDMTYRPSPAARAASKAVHPSQRVLLPPGTPAPAIYEPSLDVLPHADVASYWVRDLPEPPRQPRVLVTVGTQPQRKTHRAVLAILAALTLMSLAAFGFIAVTN